MDNYNYLKHVSCLTVEQMMNKNFKALLPEDTLKTVVKYYQKYKVNTLPVVDEEGHLLGVFPKKRLYKALLEGTGLGAACKSYMVQNPVFIMVDRTYDEYSLAVRVMKSPVDNVVVLDYSNKVVGMIGTVEYFWESLNVMQASSAMLESLFQVNYEGIIIIDNQGFILRMNPAAERMFQLQASKVKGKPLNEIFPEIERSTELQIGMKKTLGSLHVIINQVPILEKGKSIGASLAFLDVSHVEKIAEELEIVKGLHTTIDGVLNASSDGVFISDPTGSVKYVNERACNLLSKENSEIIGAKIKDVLSIPTPYTTLGANLPEVDYCEISGKKCIISHVPFKNNDSDDTRITGIVSTVYLNDNVVTEEISKKWFSLNQQVKYYKNELDLMNLKHHDFDHIITVNPEFQKIKEEAVRIAKSSSTVLLTGESGVGKDMFAKGIHRASPRANGPFVKVNSVSIPETLFESELFGYAPGSFTGALKDGKAGYFERAHQGTIFLDEIGDMPLSIQVKILQVIQEKEFVRVGGTGKQFVDVRIIAATNRDLREAIAQKTFREDLFYRLNVIQFHLPSLRQRMDDILVLAEFFIEKYNRKLGSKVTGIDHEAKEALRHYSWPGNIRELENAIERAANYVWEGEIGVDHLPDQIFVKKKEDPVVPSRPYHNAMNDYEKEILIDALKKTGGNKSAAARLLNLSRSAFYDRLEKYDLK